MFGRVVAALARAMAPTRVADARRRGPHARGVAPFVALALQYASQPFLRARYAANARASALVLSVEIAKATLCACALLRRRETRACRCVVVPAISPAVSTVVAVDCAGMMLAQTHF